MSKFARRQVIIIEAVLFLAIVFNVFIDTNAKHFFLNQFLILCIAGFILALSLFIFGKYDKFVNFIDYVKIIFIVFMLLNLSQSFFILPAKTDGDSMYNTIEDGDYLLSRVKDNFNKGDIVILNHDKNLLVKRVIATEGDNYYINDGELYVNGIYNPEEYLGVKPSYKENVNLSDICFDSEDGEYLDCSKGIPDGYLLVMGDNRDVSLDSRSFGLVKEKNVLAEVFFDFNKFKSVE